MMKKSGRMRWTGHVACTGKVKVHTKFDWKILRKETIWIHKGVDTTIMSKWMLNKWDSR
jgi:hypothetical protein